MSVFPAWFRQRPVPRVITEGSLLLGLGLLAMVSARLAASEVAFTALLATGLAPVVPLAWRHQAPMAVFLLAQVVAVPSRLLVGANGPAELALLVAIYTVASRRNVAQSGSAVAIDVVILASVLTIAGPAQPVGIEVLGQLAASVVAALLGLYVQSRRTAERVLRERADRLEREREVNARAAVEEERRRISRELHDVVAHHVSVMTLKAGAMEKQLHHANVDPVLEETAAGIRQTGQQAMTELRRLLGLLRRDDDDDGRSPQPDLGALDLLVARMRDAGMPIELTVTGPAGEVSAGMALAVYRIVQEAVTNTLRHAGPVPASVRVTIADDEVELRIRDHGTRAATPPRYPTEDAMQGHGIVGMRERASLFAGTVDAGPHPDGGFEVHAFLPRDHP
jgi:signal transduction histidine kinase